MKTKKIPLFALLVILLSGCSLSVEDTAQTETSPETSVFEEEIITTAGYSHIEIIQETTSYTAVEIETSPSDETAETSADTEAQTDPPEETLPIDEDSISAEYSAINGSDIIYFGNAYYDSDLDHCGVLFVTADGRAYGGICGYQGNFRSTTYADYLGSFTDITEFGQLSEHKAELLTKYALSADPVSPQNESETDFVLECVSWYECVTYDENGAPMCILAHADEYGYSCSTTDIYIAEIANNLAESGIISQWQQFCADNLNN